MKRRWSGYMMGHWTDHVSQDKSHERADMDDEKSEAEKPVELSD